MDESDFEGSAILEQLAANGLVDEFLEAIDSDDFATVASLLRQVDIDEESIQMVIKKINSSHFQH